MCFLHSSSAAVSVKDSNGTFVSTLSMILYNVSMEMTASNKTLTSGCTDAMIFDTFKKATQNIQNSLWLRHPQHCEINMLVWSLNQVF